MNNIIIMGDSTCDLNEELKRKHNIGIIPLYINFNNDYYKDGQDIDTEGLYQKVNELNQLPKTAAINPSDFIEAFEPHIKNNDQVIYIGISSHLSCTIQNAIIASSEFPENAVTVIDSYNLSTGIGLLVLKACKLRDQGLSVLEIKEQLLSYRPKVKSSFVINSFDYLHKGGRCSAMASVIGTALNMKPIIKVKNGKMDVGHKPLGYKKALNILFKNFKKDYQTVGIEEDVVMITNAYAPEAVAYIKEKLSTIIDPKCFVYCEAGCVISSHCGKGTFGVLYITK